MKNLILLTLIFCSISCHAQGKKFPDGVYLNISQLQNRAPAFDADLKVEIYNGQSLLSSTIDTLNRKYLQNKVVAYVKNDSVFLNTTVHPQLQHRFSLAITTGTYLVFLAQMTRPEIDRYSRNGFIINNIIGYRTGPISNYIAIGWLLKRKTYAYVLSLKTGKVKLLVTDYLHERLKENPELWEQYSTESLSSDTDLYLKYFNLLNERVK